MVHANLMARALRLVAPVPALVSTIHNIYEGGALLMAAYRVTNGLVDHMTIISEAAAERFIRERIVPRELLRVVPNGVDPELYGRVPPGVTRGVAAAAGAGRAIRVAGGGTVRGREGLSQHAAGVRGSRERHPEAVLCWWAAGSLQAETEALARELELDTGGSISRRPGGRAGACERRRRLCDVLGLGGHADGAAGGRGRGLPIVTTRVGGNQEAVLDGESGSCPRGTTRLWPRLCCGSWALDGRAARDG